MKDNEKVFTNIYEKNMWGDSESVSGRGSRLENTKNLRKELGYLIDKLNIKSILDVPCGDMNWMSKVELSNIKYYGFDIVKEIIDNNKRKFQHKNNYTFEQKDVIVDELPEVDLILCRDLIIHFPIDEIWKLLYNFIKSNSKYLLITKHIVNCNSNLDIKFGSFSWRNLEKHPFYFPKPLLEIKDHEKEGTHANIVLYKLKHLRPYIANHFRSVGHR